jgi:hypothetical protein
MQVKSVCQRNPQTNGAHMNIYFVALSARDIGCFESPTDFKLSFKTQSGILMG